MPWFIAGFSLGIVCLQQQAYLPTTTIQIALVAGAGGIFLIRLAVARFVTPSSTRLRGLLLGLLTITLGAALGFSYATWRADLQTAALWPNGVPTHWTRDLTLEGQIVDLVYDQAATPPTPLTAHTRWSKGGEHVQRFEFIPSRVIGDDGISSASEMHLPARLRLAAYGTQQPNFSTGQVWRLPLRLTPAYGNQNPHGFDYELWLYQRGIAATGYVRGPAQLVSNQGPRSFNVVLAQWRSDLRARIESALPRADYPLMGVITALVIGAQNEIEQSEWTLFRQTGISHLVSISGLHITMIAALMAWLGQAIWRRVHWRVWWGPDRGQPRALSLWLPAQTVAIWVGLASALLYSLLAGFGLPAQRTLYMLAAVALGSLWHRHSGWLDQLWFAALVVLVLDPWAVLASGAWLSFCAVAVLLIAGQTHVESVLPLTHWWRTLWAATRRAAQWQWFVTLGLVIPSVFFFGQFSLISPLANAVAIPLMSFVITPLALGAILLPDGAMSIVLHLAYALLAGLHALLSALVQALPFVVWQMPQLPWPYFLWGVFWSFSFIILPRGLPQRRWAGLMILPLLFYQVARPPTQEFQLTALDVGQGSAVLVTTATHHLLFDTGARYGSDSDAAQRVLLPYLKGQGIGHIDTLVLSHNDSDHTGGMLSLGREITVRTILTPLATTDSLLLQAQARGSQVRPCQAGEPWEWDGVRFEFLYPAADFYALSATEQATIKDNNQACVLRVHNGQKTVLITADGEKVVEETLLDRAAAKLKADLLIVPHHGSKTSSSADFLAAVQAREAIIQVGFMNSYKHPHPEVLARYDAMGTRVWRTDQAGALLYDSACQENTCVKAWRKIARHYWQRPYSSH